MTISLEKAKKISLAKATDKTVDGIQEQETPEVREVGKPKRVIKKHVFHTVYQAQFPKMDVFALLTLANRTETLSRFHDLPTAIQDGAGACGVKISEEVEARIEQALLDGGIVAVARTKTVDEPKEQPVDKPKLDKKSWPKELKSKFNTFKKIMEELPCNAVVLPVGENWSKPEAA